MHVQLTIVGGKANKGEVRVKVPSVIGRSRQAGLTIAHPTISRRHCELYEVDGLLHVRDLGSLNGVFVGGHRVTDAPLPPNAEFTIGPLTFRVQYQQEGQPPERQPLEDIPAAIGPVESDLDAQGPTPADEPLPGLIPPQPEQPVAEAAPAGEGSQPEVEVGGPSPQIPAVASPDQQIGEEPSEPDRAGEMPSLFPEFSPDEGPQVVFSPPEQAAPEQSPAGPPAEPEEAEVPDLFPEGSSGAENREAAENHSDIPDSSGQPQTPGPEGPELHEAGPPDPAPEKAGEKVPEEEVSQPESESLDDFLRRLGQ